MSTHTPFIPYILALHTRGDSYIFTSHTHRECNTLVHYTFLLAFTSTTSAFTGNQLCKHSTAAAAMRFSIAAAAAAVALTQF
jgi:hypothetical protein